MIIATVLAGGDADGPCYRPTILAGVRIHSEETFGPVLVAQPVDDADEAVAIANSTRYGLSAGLITRDNQRGFALARRIDAGAVHEHTRSSAPLYCDAGSAPGRAPAPRGGQAAEPG